ncbi:hypothetical protein [Zavarzinia compransoris]|uniref:Uncharacterized protein n=1 Tax=Zavarzinia compransoris TaxID=1264899 RepID=A0A317DWA1_9PROT|nr:hypothetical protein [Zavarzinia compransoris]PWR19007.1 hypothetical protein DKG75_18745 [Zavarzinia compransoris]TDP49009.1 hypothetical protein DES42_101370 [Zavarzinia compransoris]
MSQFRAQFRALVINLSEIMTLVAIVLITIAAFLFGGVAGGGGYRFNALTALVGGGVGYVISNMSAAILFTLLDIRAALQDRRG